MFSGVTLASNRGCKGSEGAVIYSEAFQTRPLIRALGPDVRITGLRLRGPTDGGAIGARQRAGVP